MKPWVGSWASVVALLWVMTSTTEVRASRVELIDNGYEGVVVAISQEIDETLGPPIIQAITDTINEASRRLFRATHRRAYFRNVKILIPKSWESTLVNRTALNENYGDSAIRIDHMNSVYKNQPYTHQPGGCGVPGHYIHLTPDYLTDVSQAAWWGPRGKVLLMEWAKLRWGIFDELGYPGDPSFPLFYILDDREDGGHFGRGAIHPTYCADKMVEGRQIDKRGRGGCTLNDQGEPDGNCRFLPYRDQLAASSLMSYPFIFSDTVVDFCDHTQSDHPHNSVAPTKHNLFCGGRSVWEVMNDHPDFAGDVNPPTDRYVDPVIEVVQHADANYALVLDYSGSMNDHYRVHKLRKTARRWLLHEVADGSYVAIIRFSKAARLIHPLRKIEDEESRKALADSLGTTADGGTSIGAGLYVAVKKILFNVTNPVILLITDGEENENPRIEHIMKNVLDSGVRVVTVAFGAEADPKLERIAQLTGGKTFTVNDVDEGLMLEDAFEGALTYQPPPPKFNTSVVIHESIYKGPGTEAGGTFNVDFSIGRNLKLRMDTNDQQHVTQPPHLIRPHGGLVGGAVFDPQTYSYSILVPMAEEGEWQWKVGISGAEESFVRVKATAQTRDPEVEPITTKAWVSTGAQDVDARSDRVIIYAEVKQGNNPVVNANVSALVTPPNDFDPPELYFLLDNGQGADTQAGDGVYSRYMTQYHGTGRYSVKAQVTDGGQAVINRGFLTAQSQRKKRSPRLLYEDDLERPDYCCGSIIPLDTDNALVTGSFNRIAVAGSVKVAKATADKSEDVLPPGEVRDLRVTLTEPSLSHLARHNISLSWTATGGDLDAGRADGYLIHMTTDASDLSEDEFGHDSSDPSLILDARSAEVRVEAGRKIHLTTVVEMELNGGNSYLFALRAIDKTGLTSSVSNIAAVHKPDLLEFMTFTSTSDIDAYYPAAEDDTNYPGSGFTAYSPTLETDTFASTFQPAIMTEEEIIHNGVLEEETIHNVSEEETIHNVVSEEETIHNVVSEEETIHNVVSEEETVNDLVPEEEINHNEVLEEETIYNVSKGDWNNEVEDVFTPLADHVAQEVTPSLASPAPTEEALFAFPVWGIWAISVLVVFVAMIIVIVSVILSKRRYGKYDCVET